MEELEKLRSLLDKNEIEYVNKSIISKKDGIDIFYNDYDISVVSHKYSYGGKEGLLEIMASFIENSVKGHLTAIETIEIIKRCKE